MSSDGRPSAACAFMTNPRQASLACMQDASPQCTAVRKLHFFSPRLPSLIFRVFQRARHPPLAMGRVHFLAIETMMRSCTEGWPNARKLAWALSLSLTVMLTACGHSDSDDDEDTSP